MKHELPTTTSTQDTELGVANHSGTLFPGNLITYSVSETIVDESNFLMPYVLITVGNQTTYTNTSSLFTIENVEVDEQRTYYNSGKTGYFKCERFN